MTPIRANYRDVGLKLWTESPSTPWGFGIDGVALDQVERDAREAFLDGIVLPELVRLARTLPGGPALVAFIIGEWNAIQKLESNYEARAMDSPGVWEVKAQGRHYAKEKYAMLRVRQTLLGLHQPSLLVTPNMLDLLDLHAEPPPAVYEPGASYAITQPTGAPDPAIAKAGMIDKRLADTPDLPEMTADQVALLHAANQAHMQVTAWHTGTGPQPPAGIVEQAHLALESSAVTLWQQHLFMLKRFSGYVDGYSGSDLAALARATDEAHSRWTQAVEECDWRAARRADNDHAFAHRMLNVRGTNLAARFSADTPPDAWDPETAAQVIARFS